MSVLNELAFFQGERAETANVDLARRLAQSRDAEAIAEIAEHLSNKNKTVQGNCIKVLYEAGELAPELIADYADLFVDSLRSGNNRLVWGAMTALAAIAEIKADRLFERIEDIDAAIRNGSVITVDNGIKTLAKIAAANESYGGRIVPYLIRFLKACQAKDIPRHAENMAAAVRPNHAAEFVEVLMIRSAELSASQLARVKKIIRKFENT